MMNRKFAGGQSQLIGRGLIYSVPIPLSAAAYAGAFVGATDGKTYFSDGTQWRAFADESRVAQIAEETKSDVFRVLDSSRAIYVGTGGTVTEGVRYNTLNDALAYISRFVPAYDPLHQTQGTMRVWVIIESGFVIREQLRFSGGNFGHVSITSEDHIVLVDVTALTVGQFAIPGDILGHAVISGGAGARLPRLIGTRLQPTGVAPPRDQAAIDRGTVTAAYTPVALGVIQGSGCAFSMFTREEDFDGTPATIRHSGIEGFYINVVNNAGADFVMGSASLDNGVLYGLRTAGTVQIAGGSSIRGCGTNSIHCTGGNTLITVNGNEDGGLYKTGPGYGQDFRRIEGVDSTGLTADFYVNGGQMTILGTNVVRGGSNIAANTFTKFGFILRPGEAG